jgi:hypothetical protein
MGEKYNDTAHAMENMPRSPHYTNFFKKIKLKQSSDSEQHCNFPRESCAPLALLCVIIWSFCSKIIFYYTSILIKFFQNPSNIDWEPALTRLRGRMIEQVLIKTELLKLCTCLLLQNYFWLCMDIKLKILISGCLNLNFKNNPSNIDWEPVLTRNLKDRFETSGVKPTINILLTNWKWKT